MSSLKEQKQAKSSTRTSHKPPQPSPEEVAKALAEAEAEKVRNFYKEKRIRRGKTAKDHANGQKHKNAQNKDSRAAWQNDTKGSSFPVASCNGKRNRYQVTGKGGETVYLKDAKRK